MHIVIWVLTLLAVALWSLLAWGVSAVLGMDAGWVGDIGPLIQGLPWAGVIEAWMPGALAVLGAALELARSTLGWIGGFGQVLVWGVWAVGALLLVAGAVLLSLVVALVQRHAPSTPSAPPTPPTAAA